ncbi:MAG: hypothetical protein WBL50_12285 [Candidatus Acidiferrum sp.]
MSHILPKSNTNESTILLVREGAVLPPDLATENETFLPGWRMVKDFDNFALRQKIRETNWNLLQLRGGKETRVMGRVRQVILRKGVAQLLGELRGRKFNSLEIRVPVSKRFLGVLFLNISVSLRHFQCSTAI